MTTQSRINKIKREIEDILHSPMQNWIGRTVKSVKLRILNRKLHELNSSKRKKDYSA